MSENKFPVLEYMEDIERNGRMLAKVMIGERDAHALNGFRFIFVYDDESVAHKRVCPAFRFTCYEFARAARDERKSMQLFINMNGELASKLV